MKKIRIIGISLLAAALALLAVYHYLPDKKKGLYRIRLASVFSGGHAFWETKHVRSTSGTAMLRLWSPTFHIDKIHKSMVGPLDVKYLTITDEQPPALLWISGYSVMVLDDNDMQSQSDEFLCHNNLDYSPNEHYMRWDLPDRKNILSPRLITLTQGQTSLHFPEGYGLAMMTDEHISVSTQALNHNLPEANLDIRHQIELEYTYDRELEKPMKPLFQQSVFVMRPIEGHETTLQMNNTCLPAVPQSAVYYKEDGTANTGHWQMAPGKEITRSNVTAMLNLPFSTTLHYAGVHMHPFSESLELRDITADSTIYKAYSTSYRDKIGLSKLEFFSSKEGIPMFRDHEYELICIANNTSGQTQDMMATMFLYFYDKELDERLKRP